MSGDSWRRIEQIFHEAAELSPSARIAFLDRACGADPQLRREVESLLAHDASEGHLLAAAVARATEELPGAPLEAVDLSGRQLGPYAVSKRLGAGGMGVVYQAHDTQLDRPVAIKVLSLGFLHDDERRKRLLQEARAASALNHPNIVTIHAITQADALDCIVMEFVPGQTLADALPKKGFPLAEALRIGAEIAAALGAAHAAGIVHRDLKPSNVMLGAGGRVKILDFGLAKSLDLSKGGETDAPRTEAGKVFGTLPYMAPEQAQGQQVDARTDIFSLGCVLYEMTTGRRAFRGDTPISAMAALIAKDPEPLPDLPAPVAHVIEKCLRKNPSRRYQHMDDLRVELEDLREQLESGRLEAPVSQASTRRGWMRAALLGTAAGAIPTFWITERMYRARPLGFERLTFRRGDVLSARFAPGGNIVYTAEFDGQPAQTFLTQPGSREARDLGLANGRVAAISKSGEIAAIVGAPQIGEPGLLVRVPLSGGAPREVLEQVVHADWSPGGDQLAVIRVVPGRWRLEFPIGKVLLESDGKAPAWVALSPDARRIAFFGFEPVGDYNVTVFENGASRVLSRGWRTVGGMRWSPDGREVWFSGGQPSQYPSLCAVNLTGQLRVVTQLTGWIALSDLSPDKRALLSVVNSRLGLRCLAPHAAREVDLGWFDASMLQDMSSDAREVLFSELSYGEGRNPAIYLRRTDGSPAVKLGYGNRPRLSPDGKWVVSIQRDDKGSQLSIVPTGAGEPRLLDPEGLNYAAVEWMPSSRALLFEANPPNQRSRCYVRELPDGKSRAVTEEGTRAPVASPDGARIAVASQGRLWVRELSGGTSRPVPKSDGLAVIRWTAGGDALIVQARGEDLQILRVDPASGRRQPLYTWKPVEPGANFIATARISSDNKFYAYSFQRDVSTLYLVDGLR